MELLSLLLRLLIEKPHGPVNSQGKRKGLVVIIQRKADSADLGSIISHPTMPAARELITWQTLWTPGTFFISPQVEVIL